MIGILNFLILYRRYVKDAALMLLTLAALGGAYWLGRHHQAQSDEATQAELLKAQVAKTQELTATVQANAVAAASARAVADARFRSLNARIHQYEQARKNSPGASSLCNGPDSDWVRIDSDAVAAANGASAASDAAHSASNNTKPHASSNVD